MFKIHRRIEYALLALRHMSKKFPGQLTSAKEICETFHIPFDPTSRVLQLMAQNQIVKAEQGSKGGYQIITDLSKISLQELSHILVGPICLTDCQNGNSHDCEAQETCEITASMRMLCDRVNQVFLSIPVLEVLDLPNASRRKTTAPTS